MDEFNFLDFKDSLSFYDESIEINKNEIQSILDKIKDKTIARKLKIVKGSMQSSIQQFREMNKELTSIYVDLISNTSEIVSHDKQVSERIKHLPKYQKFQDQYQQHQKNFSLKVNALQITLLDLLSEYKDVNLFFVPLESTSEENLVEQVINFNLKLNKKVNNIAQKFENFKVDYQNLLTQKSTLEKLLHLCNL